MKNWSIITKIVVSNCGIVSVLLILGSVMLIRFEINLIESFSAEYLQEMTQNMDARAQEEQTALLKNIAFNSKLLSQVGASHLYMLRLDELKETLQSYLEYPEILAIQVLDDVNAPFAAAWKTPEIVVGEILPETINLDEDLSVTVDSIQEDQKIGSFQIYYTNTAITKKIDALKQRVSERADTFHRVSRSRLDSVITNQTLWVVFILIAMMVGLTVFLRVLIFKPLLTVSNIAHRLKDFDLTVRVHMTKHDEIGQLLVAISEMVHSFHNVIGQVQRAGIQVTSSSTELSAASKQQEATMTIQMEAMHKVVKRVQEIADVVTELAKTIWEVASMSEETARFASSGQTDLAQMQAAMQHMEAASRSISDRLQAIDEKADNITAVVTTITKVADQTNLLSLNAAIEAEKAGEYGRGFTVVAREIRRLADQTAVATLDIEQMVREMQSAVSAGVMEMDKFIMDVRHSATNVEKISSQLTRIIEQVQALSPSFEEVNISMTEQSENAQNINALMLHLTEEMQQTKTSLYETFSAIEQLNEAARGLQEEVSRFKVNKA